MGVLLREALRTMCVNNQWSYAVFWKVGCQNTDLLVWEESYFEPLPSTFSPQIFGVHSSQLDSRTHEKYHSLIHRMMLSNRISLVGDGMVGRAAFTGNTQWIVMNNCNRDAHPPEVVSELLLQFSAGIQTVAVIPVLPHGVVQLGSRLPIMENLGFVNDVKSLILQLGCVPGALLSEIYAAQDSADLIGVPISSAAPSATQTAFKPSALVCQQNFSSPENRFGEWKRNGFLGAEAIPANLNSWPNQNSSSCNSSGSPSSPELADQQILSSTGFQQNSNNANITNVLDASGTRNKGHGSGSADIFEDMLTQTLSRNDLFDILGLDPRSSGFNKRRGNSQVDDSDARTENLTDGISDVIDIHETGSDIYSGYINSGTDHLLDAVVSGACSVSKQISDETESCRTTLTKISNSSFNSDASNRFQGEFFEIPGAETWRAVGSTSSQTRSAHGSQISSLVEQTHNVKCEKSVSTAYSKMNNRTPKPNRKRLKTGENPRPRPKDRQMIQDRVKDLREIIPNGAKCSIDALLELTIKHMLFLQSLTKHADTLKQTGKSKIINKEDGATWAFKVGSHSMVCPIVVEDLNSPRNFLVEIRCEERGFFLEVADWIRGLGLTILKGVIEDHNDTIWARFAVEANRDVTRMEIFASLVNLLEPAMKGIGPTNSISDGINRTAAFDSFLQAASVPATGRCLM